MEYFIGVMPIDKNLAWGGEGEKLDNFIEDITGIDFLAELDDNIEERIESNVDVTNWNFNQTRVNKNYKKYSNYDTKAKEDNKPKSNVLVRCIAITQKGNQCKRNASSGDKYCWQHKK